MDERFVRALIATRKKNESFELSEVQDETLLAIAAKYRRMLPMDLVMQEGQKGYTILQWLAPELVKAGLIKNEAWVSENATKAIQLFPHKDMHQPATLLAALHPYALDYIKTAPVLVLIIANGKVKLRKQDHSDIAKTCASKFNGKLRDVMASVNIAYPLRKISSLVIRSSMLETIKVLSTLRKETLDDFIPPPEQQDKWLRIIAAWHDLMHRRFNDRSLLLDWAVKNYHPRNIDYSNHGNRGYHGTGGWTAVLNDVTTFADYAGTMHQQGRFNLDWNLRTVARDCAAWHDQLARAGQEQRFFLENGMDWECPIDYTPFPLDFESDGFKFTALRSGKDLFDDGREMRHCVASYSRQVIEGKARIYSMAEIETGSKVATVEFGQSTVRVIPAYYNMEEMKRDMARKITYYQFENKRYEPKWDIEQAKGLLNQQVPPERMAVMRKLKDRINYQVALFQHCKHDAERFQIELRDRETGTPGSYKEWLKPSPNRGTTD